MARTIRKKSYLLLEVLCSLALIALFLFPLVKSNVTLGVKKSQDLAVIKDSFLTTQAFTEVKRQLYLNEISFATLKKGTTLQFSVDSRECQADLQLLKKSDKTSLKRVGLLVQVELAFKGTPKKERQLVFVEGVIG